MEQNRSWLMFFADAKIAVQIDTYQNWKCTPVLGLPVNGLGEPVTGTNYERIAWGLSAIKLIGQYPQGYGLVGRSFSELGREKWPGSCVPQSHSGWLDLTLGIGIPGIFLLISALLLNLKNLIRLHSCADIETQCWSSTLFWIILSFLLMWCTTEISQKVFLDELIFFLALAGGFIAMRTACIEFEHSKTYSVGRS